MKNTKVYFQFLEDIHESNLIARFYYRQYMEFLTKVTCKDKSCPINTGKSGELCRRHSDSYNTFTRKLAEKHINNEKEREKYKHKDYHHGLRNYLCLSCFAVNRYCHCEDRENSVISIGVKFRVPTNSTSKRMWIKEIKKFPRLLQWTEYPLEKLGCNYISK